MDNSCTFCGFKLSSNRLVRKNTWKGVRQFNHCRNCHGYTLLPRLTDSDMSDLYKSYYNDVLKIDSCDSLDDKFLYLKKFLEEEKGIRRVLDFGCGVDGYLPSMSGQMHFTVDGFEVSSKTLDILQNTYPNVVFYDPKSFMETTTKYDLIVLSDVLEHLSDPSKLLMQLKSRLAPGGRIWIQQPLENNRTLFTSLLKIWALLTPFKSTNIQPFHVSFASQKSLQCLIARSGYFMHSCLVSETMWPAQSQLDFGDLKNSALTLVKYLDSGLAKLIKNYGTRVHCVIAVRGENHH